MRSKYGFIHKRVTTVLDLDNGVRNIFSLKVGKVLRLTIPTII